MARDDRRRRKKRVEATSPCSAFTFFSPPLALGRHQREGGERPERARTNKDEDREEKGKEHRFAGLTCWTSQHPWTAHTPANSAGAERTSSVKRNDVGRKKREAACAFLLSSPSPACACAANARNHHFPCILCCQLYLHDCVVNASPLFLTTHHLLSLPPHASALSLPFVFLPCSDFFPCVALPKLGSANLCTTRNTSARKGDVGAGKGKGAAGKEDEGAFFSLFLSWPHLQLLTSSLSCSHPAMPVVIIQRESALPVRPLFFSFLRGPLLSSSTRALTGRPPAM